MKNIWKKVLGVIISLVIFAIFVSLGAFIGSVLGGILAPLIMGAKLDFVVSGGKTVGAFIGGFFGASIAIGNFFPGVANILYNIQAASGFESTEDVCDWYDSMKARDGDKDALQRMIVRRMRKK